jgi:hypothetical protein
VSSWCPVCATELDALSFCFDCLPARWREHAISKGKSTLCRALRAPYPACGSPKPTFSKVVSEAHLSALSNGPSPRSCGTTAHAPLAWRRDIGGVRSLRARHGKIFVFKWSRGELPRTDLSYILRSNFDNAAHDRDTCAADPHSSRHSCLLVDLDLQQTRSSHINALRHSELCRAVTRAVERGD